MKTIDHYKTVDRDTGEIRQEVSLKMDKLGRYVFIQNGQKLLHGSDAKMMYYNALSMDIYIEHRTLKYKVVRYL